MKHRSGRACVAGVPALFFVDPAAAGILLPPAVGLCDGRGLSGAHETVS